MGSAERPPLPAGKTTRALGGRFRIAVAQSVGAGCRAAGTLSTQMRHMPAGGRYAFGIGGSGSFALADCAVPCTGTKTVRAKRRLKTCGIGRAYPV